MRTLEKKIAILLIVSALPKAIIQTYLKMSFLGSVLFHGFICLITVTVMYFFLPKDTKIFAIAWSLVIFMSVFVVWVGFGPGRKETTA